MRYVLDGSDRLFVVPDERPFDFELGQEGEVIEPTDSDLSKIESKGVVEQLMRELSGLDQEEEEAVREVAYVYLMHGGG